MKELLEYMARNLVDNPEAVQIKERVGRYTVTYELTVAPDETGKVIGRSGRVAKSIRDLTVALLRDVSQDRSSRMNLTHLPRCP